VAQSLLNSHTRLANIKTTAASAVAVEGGMSMKLHRVLILEFSYSSIRISRPLNSSSNNSSQVLIPVVISVTCESISTTGRVCEVVEKYSWIWNQNTQLLEIILALSTQKYLNFLHFPLTKLFVVAVFFSRCRPLFIILVLCCLCWGNILCLSPCEPRIINHNNKTISNR